MGVARSSWADVPTSVRKRAFSGPVMSRSYLAGRSGTVSEDHWADLSATLAHSAENNLYPADRSSLTPSGQVIADFQG